MIKYPKRPTNSFKIAYINEILQKLQEQESNTF